MLNYFLQFILIAMAWFTSLSRISDYKHHCKYCMTTLEAINQEILSIKIGSDVLAGALLGFLFAIFVCRFILKLHKREQCSTLKLPTTTKYELNSSSPASQINSQQAHIAI